MAGRIRDVWAHNVESEMAVLREAISKYPYVAMVSGSIHGHLSGAGVFPFLSCRDLAMLLLLALQDTEFPGIVARPIGTFKGSSDYHYQTLRCNVDLLKLIQLGITLSDENGELPPPNEVCTWQFNFSFSVK